MDEADWQDGQRLLKEPVTSGMHEGQRPSGEAEPATSRLPASGEVHATDVDSKLHTAIGAHQLVDRAPTGVLETVNALTETGTEADGGRRDTSVDFSSGSRGATWGASNGRDVHPTVRRCYTRFQGRNEPYGTW